jgi:DNA-binding MarR family transcriptional regulator
MGLSASQHQALLAIQGYPERSVVSVGELSERLQIEPHSTVGLLDRLEKRNLVKRETSKEDRRCVQISLTEEGLDFLDKLSRVHRQELKRVGPELYKILKHLEEEIGADE